VRDLLRILLPLLVWLASFSAIYGLHGLGCALGWAKVAWLGLSLFRWALLIAWFAAIELQLLLLWVVRRQLYKRTSRFYHQLNLVSAWSALIATAWTLFPVTVSSNCV
jgi:hypothetical protein